MTYRLRNIVVAVAPALVAALLTSFVATGSTGKVRGSFEKVIWEGIASNSGAGMNTGALAVELVE